MFIVNNRQLFILLLEKKAFIVDIKKKIRKKYHLSTDFWNILSSCDVVYKGRWLSWHTLVTDLFYDFVSILLV